MTDSNRTRFALVKEATRNTTPSNPIFQIMRATGITLTDNNQTVVSDEIRSDRMTSGEILVGRAGGEGFNFEFSNSHFDDLLVAALLGTRTRIAFKYNNGVADSEITAVTDSSDTYTVNSGGAAFKTGHLAKAEGFTNAANNQIFRVASSTGTTVVGSSLTLMDETAPPGTAKLQVIGFQGASGDITATSTGLGSTALDFTTLGLAVGQLVKIGDASNAAFSFSTAALNTYARITAIAATALTLDNLPTGWATDAGTSKTIRVFTADYVRVGTALDGNTFTAETTHLGQATPTYFVDRGLGVNTFTLNAPARDKLSGSFGFTRGGGSEINTAILSGATYVDSPTSQIYNTSSNIARVSENGTVVGSPIYATAFTLNVNNNLRELAALGNLEAVDIGKGQCTVTGNFTTYFGSKALYERARALTDTALLIIFQKDNQAYGFNFPQVQLSAPRPNAAGTNQDVTVDASFNTAKSSTYATSCQFDMFPYVN
jgi:hypothetical protein